MSRRHLVLALIGCAAALALPARARRQERSFPAHSKRGKMTPSYFPELLIDGKVRRMSPAGRIFNQDNLIDTAGTLRGTNLPVRYTEDADGNIDRLWLLTPAEARQSTK
jgi:hypothetical protein